MTVFTNVVASRVADFRKTWSVQSSAANGNPLYLNKNGSGIYTFPADALSIGVTGFRNAPGTGAGNIGSATFDPWMVACYNAGLKWKLFQTVGWATEVNSGFDETDMLNEYNRVKALTSASFIEAVEGPNEPENPHYWGASYWYKGVRTGNGDPWDPLTDYMVNLMGKFHGAGTPNIPVYGISHTGGQPTDSSCQFGTVPTPAPGGTYEPAGTVVSDHLCDHLYTLEIHWLGNGVSGPNVGSSQTIDPQDTGDQFDNNLACNHIHGWVANIPGYANINQVNAYKRGITEFGYRTQTSGGSPATPDDCDSATQGKCIIMGMMNAYLKGNTVTSIYQLYDGDGYGLFSAPGTPYTSGTYLQHYAQIMNDIGGAALTFVPGSINMNISGLSSAPLGFYKLLQDQTGLFHLNIGKRGKNWDTTTQAPVTVTPDSVTLTFDVPYDIKVFDFTSSGTVPVQTASAATSITINVADVLLDVQLTPAAVGPAATIQIDMYGDISGGISPQFTVAVDGAQYGGTYTTSCWRLPSGNTADQYFLLNGPWGTGTHTLTFTFTNPGTVGGVVRRLGIRSVSYNGACQNYAAISTNTSTPISFSVGSSISTKTQPMPDKIIVSVAPGATGKLTYDMDGTQFTDPTAAGQSLFRGNFTAGAHTLGMTASGGSVTVNKVTIGTLTGGGGVFVPSGGSVTIASGTTAYLAISF